MAFTIKFQRILAQSATEAESATVRFVSPFVRCLTPLTISCLILVLCYTVPAPGATQNDLVISNVRIAKEIFNPAAGESISIAFNLSQPAAVTVRVLDFDWGIVRVLSQARQLSAGDHSFSWNGKDSSGGTVPDEAYTFEIEAEGSGSKAIYAPYLESGGIAREIERVKLLSQEQMIEYELPENARVCITAGIVNGPLLAIPVNWEPRLKGLRRERWDGMDQDKTISVLNHPHYKVRTRYMTFPENTVLTTGNMRVDYAGYKRSAGNMPSGRKSTPASKPSSVLKAAFYDSGLLYAKAPPLEVLFLAGAVRRTDQPLKLQKNVTIQIAVADDWKALYPAVPYEVYFFLDQQIMFEEPRIKLPHETRIDFNKHPPGEHILGINLISPRGQAGVKNIRFRLE